MIFLAVLLAILVNVCIRIDSNVGRGLQLGCSLVAPLPIFLYFFYRQGRSASIGQAFLAFTEAVLWMFPLIGLLLITQMDNKIAHTFGIVRPKLCDNFNITMLLSPEMSSSTQVRRPGDEDYDSICLSPRQMEEMGCAAPAVHWFVFDSSYEGIQFTVPNLPNARNTGCIDGECVLRNGTQRQALREQLNGLDSEAVNKTALGSVSTALSGLHMTLTSSAVMSFFRKSFLEETLKYVAVRNLVYSTRVVDPGSLLVYSLAAATGFIMMENFLFALYTEIREGDDQLTLNVLFFRMLSLVPLHLMIGLLIGCMLSYRRFFRYGRICCLSAGVILILPVCLHGAYDFILIGGFLFFPETDVIEDDESHMLQISYALFFLANLVTLSGWVIVRWLWLRLVPICHVDVQRLIDRELVPSPLLARCLCLDWRARCMDDPCMKVIGKWCCKPKIAEAGYLDRIPRIVPDCCMNCNAAIYIHSHFDSECPYCYMKQPPTDVPSRITRASGMRFSGPPVSIPAIELSPMDDECQALFPPLEKRGVPIIHTSAAHTYNTRSGKGREASAAATTATATESVSSTKPRTLAEEELKRKQVPEKALAAAVDCIEQDRLRAINTNKGE